LEIEAVTLTAQEEEAIRLEALESINKTSDKEVTGLEFMNTQQQQNYKEIIAHRTKHLIKGKELALEPIYAKAYKTVAAAMYLRDGYKPRSTEDFTLKDESMFFAEVEKEELRAQRRNPDFGAGGTGSGGRVFGRR